MPLGCPLGPYLDALIRLSGTFSSPSASLEDVRRREPSPRTQARPRPGDQRKPLFLQSLHHRGTNTASAQLRTRRPRDGAQGGISERARRKVLTPPARKSICGS